MSSWHAQGHTYFYFTVPLSALIRLAASHNPHLSLWTAFQILQILVTGLHQTV